MERRTKTRRRVSWRVRLWLAQKLGFIDARAVDVSSGGLGIELRMPKEQKFIAPGQQIQVEVTFDGQPVLQDTMTVRHITPEKVGLQFAYRRPPLDAPVSLEADEAESVAESR